jgi:hypothetical protein
MESMTKNIPDSLESYLHFDPGMNVNGRNVLDSEEEILLKYISKNYPKHHVVDTKNGHWDIYCKIDSKCKSFYSFYFVKHKEYRPRKIPRTLFSGIVQCPITIDIIAATLSEQFLEKKHFLPNAGKLERYLAEAIDKNPEQGKKKVNSLHYGDESLAELKKEHNTEIESAYVRKLQDYLEPISQTYAEHIYRTFKDVDKKALKKLIKYIDNNFSEEPHIEFADVLDSLLSTLPKDSL